jgi:hydrogenase maturation protease
VIRLIGVGAEDRGDDAAGLLVARRVRAVAPPGVEIVESSGDVGELVTLLADAERVILVDAAAGDGQPGAVEVVAAGAACRTRSRSTHGLGVAEALALAEALGTLPAVVRIYAVHGSEFGPGPASAQVEAGVRAAAGHILREELSAR